MIKYLSLKEVLRLHFQIIEDFGGSHGIRDENRLASLILAPKQEVFGVQQYPGIFQKAAVYVRNFIGDHSFVDGNKRTSVTVAAIFLARNNYILTASPKELEDFAIEVAVKKLEIDKIAAWFKQHTKQA